MSYRMLQSELICIRSSNDDPDDQGGPHLKDVRALKMLRIFTLKRNHVKMWIGMNCTTMERGMLA